MGLWALLLAAALAALLALGTFATQDQGRQQGALAIRQTILDSALQCMAIEGAYPPTLRYLEDRYGLVVNHEGYAITYEALAPNVMPAVRVVPR